MFIRKRNFEDKFRQQPLKIRNIDELYLKKDTENGLFLAAPKEQLLLLAPVTISHPQKIISSSTDFADCYSGFPDTQLTVNYSEDRYTVTVNPLIGDDKFSNYSDWITSLTSAPNEEPPEKDYEIFDGNKKISFADIENKKLSDIRIIFSRLSNIRDNNLETQKEYYDTPYYSLNPTGSEADDYEISSPQGKIPANQFLLKATDKIVLAPIVWVTPKIIQVMKKDGSFEYSIRFENLIDQIGKTFTFSTNLTTSTVITFAPGSDCPNSPDAERATVEEEGLLSNIISGQIFTLPYFKGDFSKQATEKIPASGRDGWTIDPNQLVGWSKVLNFTFNPLPANNIYNYPLYSKSARLDVADSFFYPYSSGGGFPDITLGWIERAGFIHYITETRTR